MLVITSPVSGTSFSKSTTLWIVSFEINLHRARIDGSVVHPVRRWTRVGPSTLFELRLVDASKTRSMVFPSIQMGL